MQNDWIRDFLKEKILVNIKEIEEYEKETGQKVEIGSHGFRHHLATVVQSKTRDTKATQFVLGHRNEKMTMEYLKSRVSRETLLYSIVDGYEKKEISGKFYLKLLDMINQKKDSDIVEILNKKMALEDYLKEYGLKRDMGWCTSQDG